MTKTELKPCPFCGGKAYIERGHIECTNPFCGASVEFSFPGKEREAWNSRTPVEKLEAENKLLREALERIVSEHPACFADADCPHNGGAGYDQGCLSCPWDIAEEVLKERGKQ